MNQHLTPTLIAPFLQLDGTKEIRFMRISTSPQFRYNLVVGSSSIVTKHLIESGLSQAAMFFKQMLIAWIMAIATRAKHAIPSPALSADGIRISYCRDCCIRSPDNFLSKKMPRRRLTTSRMEKSPPSFLKRISRFQN